MPSWSTRSSPLRVEGAGCRVQGAGFRVQGSGCRVQGAGCRVQGSRFTVQDSGVRVGVVRVQDLGLESPDARVRVEEEEVVQGYLAHKKKPPPRTQQ